MIFKIDGSVSELLAVEPVIREWKKRSKRSSEDAYVETMRPEIFRGNPYISGSEVSIPIVGPFYDLNVARWSDLLIPVEEHYAEVILGDRNLSDWRPRMYADEHEVESAREMTGKAERPIAAMAIDPKRISDSAALEMRQAVAESGYAIISVEYDAVGSWGTMMSVIKMCDVFVGTEGDSASVAMTTDTPMAVFYSYRSPVYFPPFRRGVPFAAMVADAGVCPIAPMCFAKNSVGEFAKTYSQRCTEADQFKCMKRPMMDETKRAIFRITGKNENKNCNHVP